MHDAQTQQPLGEFGGGLGAAAVGHQGARQAAFLQRLGEPVNEPLGILGEIPLGVRAQTIEAHVRVAAHLSYWLGRRKRSLTGLDASETQASKGHLAICQCAGFKRRAKKDGRGADLFLQHLRAIGLVTQPAPQTPQQPPLLLGFCRRRRQNRGAKDATLNAYWRVILDALLSLGDDAAQFDATPPTVVA